MLWTSSNCPRLHDLTVTYNEDRLHKKKAIRRLKTQSKGHPPESINQTISDDRSDDDF